MQEAPTWQPCAKKHPHGSSKKHPHGPERTHPHITSQSLLCVGSLEWLEELLLARGQSAWCSSIRLQSLFLVIDYFARHDSKSGFPFANRLARSYISKLRNPQPAGTVREALPLLCHIGLLVPVSAAVNGWHVKASATYRLASPYRERVRRENTDLLPAIARKLQTADQRLERGLNARFSVRTGVLRDLARLSFRQAAREDIEKLRAKTDFRSSVERTVRAVDTHEHTARISTRGQITTSISVCPRELKPLLQIDGESVALCDISHAHHCFLPRILGERIDYLRTHANSSTIAAHEAELGR